MDHQLGLAGRSTATPSARNASTVESVSAEAPNPSHVHAAVGQIAPSITARWLTDLSPGTASSPVSPPAGPTRSSVGGHASTAGVAMAP